MTERPILFSAEMVRAILAGRKTQTRRVMKVQPPADAVVTVERYFPIVFNRRGEDWYGPEVFGAHWDNDDYGLRCPYGAPGDTLWVREGFAVQPELWADNRGPQPIHYTADQVIGFAGKPDTRQIEDYRSKPSIHMPRWASRITLRITDVRVERLQDISEDDAGAEGMPDYSTLSEASGENLAEAQTRLRWRQRQFANLYNRINGSGTWEANPWVWALSFEMVKP